MEEFLLVARNITQAQALALLAAEKLTPQRVYVRTAAGYEEMGG